MDVISLLVLLATHSAHAYNARSHESITRNAIAYLRTHTHESPETHRWLSGLGENEGFMEETLVRGAVDADYRADLWLDSWFRDPVAGAHAKGGFTIFTGMYHYLNVTTKGDYWTHDGYAFRHSSKQGFDSYLATPTATVKGNLSRALGGRHKDHPVHGIDLGVYNMGFRGSDRDWGRLFFDSDPEDAVFPPANVPAELAFQAMLASSRVASNNVDSWNETLPLVTGYFSNGNYARHYWRGEVTGLPRGFDLLGMTLHLTQDVTVPQHASGTGDWCHQDLEDLTDRLDCGTAKNVSPTAYRAGSFGGSAACNQLYDPDQVASILRQIQFLDPRGNISVFELLRSIAFLSARWQWGDPDWSVDFIGTILPDGSVHTADRCRDLVKIPAIQRALKYQYNLAVASSAALFEMAAHRYESRARRLDRPFPLSRTIFRGLLGRLF